MAGRPDQGNWEENDVSPELKGPVHHGGEVTLAAAGSG